MAGVLTSTWVLLILGMCFAVISGACDRNYGPSGGYECVAFSRYNNVPQWATCLTDTYIKEKSKSMGNNHECADRTRIYCYYQCMCELNNKCDGPDVYSNCSCDPSHPQTTTMSPRPTIPPWCFSPDGKTCSWYSECLEERYPCEGTDAVYAITYAQKFCELYSNHYQSFSTNGQQWIDVVRKCLQVELVPILRPWVSVTCSEIKNIAFASHSHCYTNSGVSFCSLSLLDMWKAFWTIKGAFISSFVESLKGLWDVINRCLTINFVNVDVAITRMVLKKQESMERYPDKFAGKAIDNVAEKEKWAYKGLAWFGYRGNTDTDHVRRKRQETPRNSTSESEFPIDIVIASKRVFDLNAPNAINVNTTETVMRFASSVQNGQMELTVDGVRVEVLYLAGCVDIECNDKFVEAVSLGNAGATVKVSTAFVLIVSFLNLIHRKI